MPLVTAADLTIGFRGPSLLESVDFQIEPNQRVGLLGRNGAGKTTLMRLIVGQEQPDSGSVKTHSGVHVAMLAQDVPTNINSRVFDLVLAGIDANQELNLETWQAQTEVEKLLSRMNLDPDAAFENMSSGMKRRVLLAKAIVAKPDLLLLDEPTNHLDIETIGWLEKFLLNEKFSLLFVTHDRMFLRRVANRILEIDRARIFDWSCDYDTFLKRKQETLEAEEKQNALFDKRLAEEEAWIRKGVKARRKRNQGRVRALMEMRDQRAQRRTQQGTSRLQIQEGQKSGNLVIEAKEISFGFEAKPIFEDFSTAIMRGDKVGIIGPNGVGKSTLLKTLLGEFEPTSGKIKRGTNLQIAYFDQLRQQLDPEETVEENIGQGNDSVVISGTKKHVLGYLQDFLFEPQRARTQIKFLSGGEQNRILLARLFAQPANVIVLDEPTNDLDAETLELLEEKLVEFNGTILLVSHDRAFLNNVVTNSIVFEEGRLKEYVGGYDDWQRQIADRESNANEQVNHAKSSDLETTSKRKSKTEKPRRLSYNEKRELEGLPGKIDQLETNIGQIHRLMAEPEFYQQPGEVIAQQQEQLKTLESDLQQAYQRWEALESVEG